MRPVLALALAAAALVSGCSGDSATPESVVRSWSEALNAGDNDGAADLFARGATVVQGGVVLRLRTRADAVRFNESLPCSGRIVALSGEGETARATFLLGDRQRGRCDGPGARAKAVFRVRDGKIVLWHQLAETPEPPTADA